MSELPKGWVEASLGEVCHLQNGRAYKQEELLSSGKYPVLRVGNFFTSQKWYYSDLELEPTKYCDDGDLLYAWSASFGPRIWSGGKVIFHYHIWRVDLESSVSDRDFVFHWFNWDKENIKAAHGTGSTMIHVTKGDMEQRRISLPPLAEQKRIVAKLDALNAKSARARTELARIETLVSRYKQAVLSKAFSGELTREWRRLLLGETLTQAQVGLVRSKEQQFASGGTPYVRMNHFDLEGRWHLEGVTQVEASAEELRHYALQTGDVLFNTRNSFELVGKVAYWEGSRETFLYNNNILRMRFDETIDSKFAFYQMQSAPFRAYLETVKSATTSVCAIYQKALVQAPFVAPKSFSEQNEIVRRIESAFAKIDRLAKEAKRALELVGRLDEAILAKAFRGELVPQDENDEPAEHLLARIRAEREAAPKAKRGRGAKV